MADVCRNGSGRFRTTSRCFICLEENEARERSDTLHLTGSGNTVKARISQWERTRCPFRPKKSNVSILFLNHDAATDLEEFSVCCACFDLVSRMDQLEVDLEKLFCELWSLVARHRDVPSDSSESVEVTPYPVVTDPLRVQPSSPRPGSRASVSGEVSSADADNPDACLVKIESESSAEDVPLFLKDETEFSDPADHTGCERRNSSEEFDGAEVDHGEVDWTPDVRGSRKRKPMFSCEVCRKGFTSANGLKRHVHLCSMSLRSTRVSARKKRKGVEETSTGDLGKSSVKTEPEIGNLHERFEAAPASVDFLDDANDGDCNNSSTQKDEPKKHPCDACGRPLANAWALKRHRTTCHALLGPTAKEKLKETKNFTCDICGESFIRASGVVSHKRFVHEVGQRLTSNGELLRKFSCVLCELGFDVRDELNEHEQTAHAEALRYACPECGKKFLTSRKLINHKQCHESAICTICGLKLNGKCVKERLKAHVAKKHNQEKQWKCKDCGEAFFYEQTLWRHQWKIHGLRKDRFEFPCPNCAKVLESSRGLKMHKFSKHGILEEGLEVSTCDRCGKSFAKKKAYEAHVRLHDDIRPHACPHPECGYRAVVFVSLKGHMRTAHKRNVRRVFPDGSKDETVYSIVDMEEIPVSAATDVASTVRS